MKKRVICENLRSAYNVGNIIRTADGLDWGVVLVGYTAPKDHKKVVKTALGAEELIPLIRFHTLDECYQRVSNNNILMLSAEIYNGSFALDDPSFVSQLQAHNNKSAVALVLGNELTGVEQTTLQQSDYIVHIPMSGSKESFNVGQAAAICMRQIGNYLKN